MVSDRTALFNTIFHSTMLVWAKTLPTSLAIPGIRGIVRLALWAD
jgi:hypothetical protein